MIILLLFPLHYLKPLQSYKLLQASWSLTFKLHHSFWDQNLFCFFLFAQIWLHLFLKNTLLSHLPGEWYHLAFDKTNTSTIVAIDTMFKLPWKQLPLAPMKIMCYYL